jgi:hypothetical protein
VKSVRTDAFHIRQGITLNRPALWHCTNAPHHLVYRIEAASTALLWSLSLLKLSCNAAPFRAEFAGVDVSIVNLRRFSVEWACLENSRFRLETSPTVIAMRGDASLSSSVALVLTIMGESKKMSAPAPPETHFRLG